MAKIVIDPKIMLGKPTVDGTRITVSLILNLLAHGVTIDEIIEDYHLTRTDIRAALEFAEKTVEKVYPPARTIAQ